MNIFNIIGPVMIGPSSSHTAGAVRIGRIAYKILGERAVKARIGLCGSFAQTYKGHGTDRALLAGIMNMSSDDSRIPDSLAIAKQTGLNYEFYELRLPDVHPNTAVIELIGEHNTSCQIQGASIGGGNILIERINGLDVFLTGQYNTLLVLHQDVPGTIAAVTNSVAYSGINIGNFRLSRPKRGGLAVMTIEVDGEVPSTVIEWLRHLPHINNVILIHSI